MLSPIVDLIRSIEGYAELVETLRDEGKLPGSLHLSRSIRPLLAAALLRDLDGPIIYLVPKMDRLLTLQDELPIWSPETSVLAIPDPSPLFYDPSPWGPRAIRGRITAFSSLAESSRKQIGKVEGGQIYLGSTRAIMTRTRSPETFSAEIIDLAAGAQLQPKFLLDRLVRNGYEPSSVVVEAGSFSARGGILDLWPVAATNPVRIEFVGDEVESLRTFDPASQRSVEKTEAVTISPAREAPASISQEQIAFLQKWVGEEFDAATADEFLDLLIPLETDEYVGALDYLPEKATILFDDQLAIQQEIEEIEQQAINRRQELISEDRLLETFPRPYLTQDELEETAQSKRFLDLGMMQSQLEHSRAYQFISAFSQGERFGGQLRPLIEHLSKIRLRNETAVIVSRQAARLAELWSENDRYLESTESLAGPPQPGQLYFVQGALSDGWMATLPGSHRLHLITDAEIFGWSRPRPRSRPQLSIASPESSYAEFKPDEIIVHMDYGVSCFVGLVERKIDEISREYLLVEFAGGDQVYVPIHQADRLTAYIGVEGSSPSLSRLGTQEWDNAKGRAQKNVEEIARDLLDLYASRLQVRGHAFAPDAAWQGELEGSFPYYETEDQVRAIQVIKDDMERARPMDRLICGDAGYGKTEVAVRAAFKAVMDGKQVAMLVPTTVLAQQHYDTFTQRLAAFPVEVEMLSRFRTQAEAAAILKKMAKGEIDILIGTHRILQTDVAFMDLGLLIIDEEQRFGVTHKEFLKKMRTEVDVLTMTATPIPRTLYMALTGARDISTINTPPEERLPVRTHVGAYDPELVQQAILREIDRGGQIFYVHNRVKTIQAAAARLKRLLPDLNMEIAHGQMSEDLLADVMVRFTDGEIDVLISTSIIESGLDIPNANTLIVERSDRFGLGQLYQLRGRVGRASMRGYAYFFVESNGRMTEDALQRLETIAEHGELGAGYSIAMRDLEIRGAGDILGTRQHGHIAAIGFHLYTRLLSNEVHRLRAELDQESIAIPTEKSVLPLAVSIELPLPAAIPDDYIEDRDLRLRLYRRLGEIRDPNDLDSLSTEMKDRFGPLPDDFLDLLFQIEIRILAASRGVTSISSQQGQLRIQLPSLEENTNFDLGQDVRISKKGIWMRIGDNQHWRSRLRELLLSLPQTTIGQFEDTALEIA